MEIFRLMSVHTGFRCCDVVARVLRLRSMEQRGEGKTGEEERLAPRDELLRPREAAKMLGISCGTLYNWTYQRRIPAVKLGRTLRFSRLALERFIRAHTQPARA